MPPTEHRDPHSRRSNRSRSPRPSRHTDSRRKPHSRSRSLSRSRSRSPSRSASRNHRRDRRRSRSGRDHDRTRDHRPSHSRRHNDGSDSKTRPSSSSLRSRDRPEQLSTKSKDAMTAPVAAVELPFGARQLHKREFTTFLPLLAYYLDLQKQKDLYVMDEREAKGRWKSFLGKWNRGQLAEGWYDPAMFVRSHELYGQEPLDSAESEDGMDADRASASVARSDDKTRDVSVDGRSESVHQRINRQEDPVDLPAASGDDSDDVGPAPAPLYRAGGGKHNVRVPGFSDLAMRDEQRRDDRAASIDDLRYERRLDRKLQKERLEELVPRPDPGSRERKLEKKAEIRNKLRPASPGADQEVDDSALMGGGDSIAELKRRKEGENRKKTGREKRREEIWRAREAEREERVREYREREEATVKMLREFARSQMGNDV